MVGLITTTPADTSALINYRSLDLAVHLTALDTVLVWYKGSFRASISSDYSATDVFEVLITDTGFYRVRINNRTAFTSVDKTTTTTAHRAHVVLKKPSAGVRNVAWVSKQVRDWQEIGWDFADGCLHVGVL
jgi:hypothetical protein